MLKNVYPSLQEAEAVEYLLNSYPNYVSIDSVPLKTNQNKVSLAVLIYFLETDF